MFPNLFSDPRSLVLSPYSAASKFRSLYTVSEQKYYTTVIGTGVFSARSPLQHCIPPLYYEPTNFIFSQVDHYEPVFETRSINVRPTHRCETVGETLITVIDEYGNVVHTIEIKLYSMLMLGIEHFAYCNCEPIAVTLAQAELWPATPIHPRCAFISKY